MWYILHFIDETGGAIGRSAYQEKIEKEMREKLGIDRKYKKNAEDMFQILRPYTLQAIDRAQKSLEKQSDKSYHEMNPATTVHELVKELVGYLDKDVFVKT